MDGFAVRLALLFLATAAQPNVCSYPQTAAAASVGSLLSYSGEELFQEERGCLSHNMCGDRSPRCGSVTTLVLRCENTARRIINIF